MKDNLTAAVAVLVVAVLAVVVLTGSGGTTQLFIGLQVVPSKYHNFLGILYLIFYTGSYIF